MGARQSKRSVDITTGKEAVAEGGEVAAGAGGEGKLERIEDLDTLKPQLNGDAAHQDTEISEKEKKMQEEDEAQENAKDNSNEKEIILTPVTVNGNGEGEGEVKDGENTPEPESNKKPKKEKVKKKWSIRSISFSKKDKQKPPKKETNGDAEKVPEEVSDAAVDIKAEIPAVAEVTKCDDSERANEKAPETPVTEPLTNGSSAPETPKEEEVRQNGDSISIGEQPIIADKVPEVEAAKISESPKLEEKPEVPSVDSLPINGLKIEESAAEDIKSSVEVEVPPPVAEKVEEVVIAAEQAPEPVEEKPAVVAEAEVCVEQEAIKAAGGLEVAPPPLPSCPPPSSVTMFAESTMEPLVDTVTHLPVVDVDASIPTQSEESVQSTPSDPLVQLVCDKSPVNNLPTALPNDIASPSVLSEISAEPNISSSDIAIPVLSDNVKLTEISSPIENVAVVSPNEIVSEPPMQLDPPALNPLPDTPLSLIDADVQKNISPVQVDSLNSSPIVSETLDDKLESVASQISKIPQNLVDSKDLPLPEELPLPEAPLPSKEETKSLIENSVSEEAIDSPVLPRAFSDLDVSEATAAEPPSDSFPPPPPPESCPESMTELSVSESLPPPLSENSLPDTVVNSPTSEIADLPSKDDVPQKDLEIPHVEETQERAEAKVEEQAVETPAFEQPLPPAPLTQVENIHEVAEVPAEVPAPEVAAESAPVGDSSAE